MIKPSKKTPTSRKRQQAARVLPRKYRDVFIRKLDGCVERERHKEHTPETLADAMLYTLQRACEDHGAPRLVPRTFNQGDLLCPSVDEVAARFGTALDSGGLADWV